MFLSESGPSESRSALFALDSADGGYVSNLARLWAWRPDVFDAFLKSCTLLAEEATHALRERAILVCATAARIGDSYCALAWGTTLAIRRLPPRSCSAREPRR